MQKEANKQGLYTAIFEYDGNVFIRQFKVKVNNLKDLFGKWAQLATNKKIIADKEDKQILLKEKLTDDLYRLRAIIDSKNAWWSFFLLSKDLGSLVIVKTDQQVIGSSAYEKQKIWKQYAFFKDQYERLKDVGIKTKEIAKERKKCERLMHYWEQKKLASSSHQGNEQVLYTIVLEYNGDVIVCQAPITPGESINNLFRLWLRILKKHKTFDNGYEKDYEIIIQRAQDKVYELAPVTGLINVWSTYFTLSKGLGNIYVIKTDEEITPGG